MARNNSKGKKQLVQEVLTDDPDFLRSIVESVIQEILEMEMTRHIGAAPYERSKNRKGQRNGYKPRILRTRVGKLNLLVPQDREGRFSTSLFGRYQRSEKALLLSLMQMYLQGVSTRKTTRITETLCGTSFSKSQVSALTSRLDAELAAWRERPLTHKYPCLIVDARYEDVRIDGSIVSQGVLIVKGVRQADGKREILAVAVADTESEATWQEVFANLKTRGLSGVKLVTSDHHAGIMKAVRKHFQGAGWQRCQMHFSKNACGLVPRSARKELAGDLREVFAASDRESAMRIAERVAERWRSKYPKVAQLIEDHIEECLAVLAFPASHRQRLRTTNGLERLNQEIKRRTRVIRIFPNRESCLRLVTALAAEQSDEWVSGKRYLNMEELVETEAEDAAAERELVAVT
jgi:transposase-like protein